MGVTKRGVPLDLPHDIQEIMQDLPVINYKETILFPGAKADLAVSPAWTLKGFLWEGERNFIGISFEAFREKNNSMGVLAEVASYEERSEELVISLYVLARIKFHVKLREKEGLSFCTASILEEPENVEGELLEGMAEIWERMERNFILLSRDGEDRSELYSNFRKAGNLQERVLILQELLHECGTWVFSVDDRYNFFFISDIRDKLVFIDKVMTRQALLQRTIEKISQENEEAEDTQNQLFELEILIGRLTEEKKNLTGIEEYQGLAKELMEKLEQIQEFLDEESRDRLEKEISRVNTNELAFSEDSMTERWLEYALSLPWRPIAGKEIAFEAVEEELSRSHYGLQRQKQRILEHVAVKRLNPEAKGSTLCFVGPKGTGKTTFARSVARALGLPFCGDSLNGLQDEAEIKGHRRTYVGALPGKIIESVRRAGAKNAVIFLDEIDKMGSASIHGDPVSALLDVLDKSQNFAFIDRYADIPFDLSGILFIVAANDEQEIPATLKDRLEVIEFSGYTEKEKLGIAREYILPAVLEEYGLQSEGVEFSISIIRYIIRHYTEESGIRELRRKIEAVARKLSMLKTADRAFPDKITVQFIKKAEILGAPLYLSTKIPQKLKPGVSLAPVYTENGGEIMFIEVAVLRDKDERGINGQEIRITGNVGNVMEEAARVALTCLVREEQNYFDKKRKFQNSDIHIHYPNAASKEGPSAGLATALALYSLGRGVSLPARVVYTGEITLNGAVLPIGGLREKALGALRAGIEKVLIPKGNELEIRYLPAEVRKGVEFIVVGHIDEAIEVLEGLPCCA